MLQNWPHSLWWKQRNRVKLQIDHRCSPSVASLSHTVSLSASASASASACAFTSAATRSKSQMSCQRSRQWLAMPLRLLIISLVLSCAIAQVEDEIPFMSNRRGNIILASRQAVATSINVTQNKSGVCEVATSAPTTYAISVCCDGNLAFSLNSSTYYNQGREYFLVLPAASGRKQLRVHFKDGDRDKSCAALVLCYGDAIVNPMPVDNSVIVSSSQHLLFVTWTRSPRDMFGDLIYEVVIAARGEEVSDGCSVTQALKADQRQRRRTKRQIHHDAYGNGEMVPKSLFKQANCGAARTCSVSINLSHRNITINRQYFINVFVLFHGMRMAYRPGSFCYSTGSGCHVMTDALPGATTTTPSDSVSDNEIDIDTDAETTTQTTARPTTIVPFDYGKLQSQFADLALSDWSPVRSGQALSASFQLRKLAVTPRSGNVHIALFMYSCTNTTRGTLNVRGRVPIGRTNLGNQARRFSLLYVSPKAKGGEQLTLSYLPKVPNASDTPVLRLNAIYFDNVSRNALPPLANRTVVNLSGSMVGRNVCQLNVSFALNCTNKNKQCGEWNDQNVYYRLLRMPRHSSRAPSCVPTSSLTGRPLDAQALKLLPISRGQKGSRRRPLRLWTYHGSVNVELVRETQRRYFVQLFWRVVSTDSYIPFTEASFRVDPDCQVPPARRDDRRVKLARARVR